MKQISKILIPTDFSPSAWSAVQYGVSLAGSAALQITLLHVFPLGAPHPAAAQMAEAEEYESFLAKMQALCETLRPRYPHIQFCCELLRGSVAQELMRYMQKNPVDLIIMGINSSSSQSTMGKHTAALMRSSQSPLMIVPNKAERKMSRERN